MLELASAAPSHCSSPVLIDKWMVCGRYGIGCFFKLLSPHDEKRDYLALLTLEGTKSIKTQVTKKSLSSVIETFSLQNIHCTPLLREWIKGSHSPCDSQGWPDGWAQLGNFPTQQIIWDLAISAISFHIKYLIRINRGCSFVLNKASQSIYIWKGGGGAIFPWKLSQIDYGAYPAHQDMREFGTWGETSSGTAQRMGRWHVNYCQHKICVT